MTAAIDWVQEQGKGRSDEDFLVLVQDCFLSQFVDKPTRASAVLDLLLSNDPNMVEEVEAGSISETMTITLCVHRFC